MNLMTPPPAQDRREMLMSRVPDPAQTFETFVVGPSNEFACRAAEQMAQESESDIEMLFIHGPLGFGKTHLLNAIAGRAVGHGARVLFVRAQDFMLSFLRAEHSRQELAFKGAVRHVDVFVLDDVQYLCGNPAPMNEFMHTVNALIDAKGKVVLTADQPPALLKGLSDELRSRLQGALVIALENPSEATKFGILKARATEIERRRPHSRVTDEVLRYVAATPNLSPFELIALVTKIATYAEFTSAPLTVEIVKEALGGCVAKGEHRVTVEDILEEVAKFYKLNLQELRSKCRDRRLARPRQVAMYLARELTARSLADIGRRVGGRDHTTVIHACRRIKALCKIDPVLRQEVAFLRSALR